MKKFKPQHSRLLFIDKQIRDKTFPNCSSLAAQWEVSSKTIQRDIDYLKNMLDAPLDYDARKRGYYYTEENYQLPAIALNDSDLFAIFVAEKVLEQYKNTPIYARLRSVFAKIEESLPDKVSVSSSFLEEKFSFFGAAQTVISSAVWETIFISLRTSRTLEISHRKPGRQQVGNRLIDPYHVICYQGEWYVIAFCHTRLAIRTFALSRIQTATALDAFFTIPAGFNFKETTRSLFGVQWSDREYHVRIRFSARAAPYIKERQYHPTQVLTEHEDRSLIMAFTTTHLLEVKRWVLSWGNMAKVLAPPELVDEIIDELRECMNTYGGKHV